MFKTIKSKLIFVTVFCSICILSTIGAIIYKNIEIDDKQDDVEQNNNEIIVQDGVKGIDYNGTYNQNDLNIISKNVEKEKAQIEYYQIDGLKNSDIQNKINKEIENVALNCYKEKVKDLDEVRDIFITSYVHSNFANVFSISIDYVYKINDDEDGFYQVHECLNYDLSTGEKIALNKMFTQDAPIEEILRKSAYYSLITRNLEESLSGDFVVADYGDVEDDIALLVDKYIKEKPFNFFFSPTDIIIYWEENEMINIKMEEYYKYIAIYNRYLTNDSIYTQDNIGMKNLYTLTERSQNSYDYFDYENEKNYFIDVNMIAILGKEDNAIEQLKSQKIKEIEKEIEKIKYLSSQNSNNFYILNYNIYIFADDDRISGQTYLQCNVKGNSYEVTVHDFEENIEPMIKKINREYSEGEIPDYVYDLSEVLKIEPQYTCEYYNPETGEKIII